jgi:hypothetical protein
MDGDVDVGFEHGRLQEEPGRRRPQQQAAAAAVAQPDSFLAHGLRAENERREADEEHGDGEAVGRSAETGHL